ncbi:TlyA family RNA methyltransferase [Arcobacter sp. FWKO B]|uniref:23S rRNA (cytidine-2'-O)-methyltransferase TlyA n=1 Tax=Arcobacter sp. FWKO B TaxID=2593672 RepID=UPI001907313A|nr:TlyA family RNA methyltransferase [Arcobacter sp. FWKO B]
MRLDIYITTNFDIQSRNKAHELIKTNKVKVDGKIITKPSFEVDENALIEILDNDILVSRAGYKLKYFLTELGIDLSPLKGLDIGSSTGGFAQVLLKNGLSHITCVDVGTNQLHDKVKEYQNLSFFENTDIREFNSNEKYDIVTCDVSFISVHNILKDIDRLSSNHIIVLFKPQFEVGINAKRDKNGVVRDDKAILKSKILFEDACAILGWNLVYQSPSKILGKEGNYEEFYYFKK